jgi:hypothetical protein
MNRSTVRFVQMPVNGTARNREVGVFCVVCLGCGTVSFRPCISTGEWGISSFDSSRHG